MRPFLLIQTRSGEDTVADELRSTTALGGFGPEEITQMRLDQVVQEPDHAQHPLDWEALLEQHSGIILCGSPFNSGTPEEEKSSVQQLAEAELKRMLDVVVPRDYPFLGACYGVGTLGLHQGGTVDSQYGETPGAVPITLTAEGRKDPLLEGVSPVFDGWVGHQEATQDLPPAAVLLARGEDCPVQMYRIGQNMYATQFHPEMDLQGLLFRLEVYKDHGYYGPDEAEAVFARVRAASVTEPQKVLQNFRRRFAVAG